MEKLQDLSQSELQDLLDNTERVESMALESDEIQNIQLEREMALASNRSLAERNLDMKPKLERERERLVAKYSELEEMRERYKERCVLRDSIMGQVSPEGLFSRLQAEGANTETESETLADEFLEGSLSLDSFLERFLSLRSLAHKRRVRIEKLQEILRQKSKVDGDAAAAMTTQPCANQDPTGGVGAPSHWQPSQPNQPQQTSSKPNASFPNSQNPSSSALPYSPFPVSAAAQPTPVSVVGPSNPPAHFPPYPSTGSPFTPTGGFAASRPSFGQGNCPYPAQPTFPGPQGAPAPPFGHFGPSPAPYPTAYPYPGGYGYPTGNTQAPTGRPLYPPGFGVPQSFS
ncbi:vacuolar protein sorting-associated protein 37C [Denticeps clupeoides]|uniref:VPS37 C-terminal domain-containing protein n=1 Tax=Denticeps clupeoides TaxID=299321 RepID=A0AAY4A5G1_9TELE|nr:vacuolar protein sorting-associated protein 37C [Denticeps clupeoides]